MQLYDEANLPVVIHNGIFILHANPLAVKLFRFANLAEMLAMHLFDLLDDTSEPLARARMEWLRALPEEGLPPVQMIFKRADDSCFIAMVETRSLGWMGDVLRHEIIFRSVLDEVKDLP